MKKFVLRTFMAFSIIFIFLFCSTMLIEYLNKDRLNTTVNVQVELNQDGTIIVPDTPEKVKANMIFSQFYFYVGLGISVLTPILFYKFGGIEVLKNKGFKRKITEGAALCVMYAVFSEILIFSKVLFSSFYRGKLVGLKTYTFTQFFTDYMKSDIISLLISIPIVVITYIIFKKFKYWYLIVAASVILFNIASNYVYPYIDELQNELVVMEDGDLKNKVLALAEEAGIENLDVRVVKKSDETSSMNAYMTGIGKTKRIVFWDTIIDGLSEEELLSVAAHEMGHYKLNHIPESMIISSIEIIAICFIINILMKKIKGKDYRKLDNIPYILLTISIISILITPFDTWFSRKIEIEADTFAIESTNDPYTNGLLEIRFINSNLTPIKVNKLYKWLNYDHPTVEERISLSNSFIR